MLVVHTFFTEAIGNEAEREDQSVSVVELSIGELIGLNASILC